MTKEIREFTVTPRTTKAQLVKFLNDHPVADKDVAGTVKEALSLFAKDMTKVTKDTLKLLVGQVLGLLRTPAPAPIEASLKPKGKSQSRSKTSSETKTTPPPIDPSASDSDPVSDDSDSPTESQPKPKKKLGAKKSEPKKEEVDSIPPISNVGSDSLPSAKVFPAEIEHKDLGKIVACTGDYTTFDEVVKALDEDKTLYFACYWTKRQIKEFSYAASKMVDPSVVKGGFPNDLDILTAVLPCQTIPRVFAMSMYSEALFQFEGEDFMPIEDTDPRGGDKFQVRVSAGMEFEIYRPIDEEVVTTDD